MDTFKALMKQKPVATALLIFLAFLIYQPLTSDVIKKDSLNTHGLGRVDESVSFFDL